MIMTEGKKASTFPQLHGLGTPGNSAGRQSLPSMPLVRHCASPPIKISRTGKNFYSRITESQHLRLPPCSFIPLAAAPGRTGHNRKRFPEGWRKFFPGNGRGRIHTPWKLWPPAHRLGHGSPMKERRAPSVPPRTGTISGLTPTASMALRACSTRCMCGSIFSFML